MKKRFFTMLLGVVFGLNFSLFAQTTYNIPSGTAINEFVGENADANGLSTYVLERDGYYPLTGSIGFSGDIAIVAADGEGDRPYIIMGTNDEGGAMGWGLMWTDGSVTFKSLHVNISNDLGGRGPWSNAGVFTSGSNVTVDFDDCIIDYGDGVIISNEQGTGVTLIMTNNLVRFAGTNNGGKWQGMTVIFKNGSCENAYIENNTFVECYAPLMIHENGHLKKFWFNHNTVVSHAQQPFAVSFMDKGVFMNNLFVDGHFAGETEASAAGQANEGQGAGVLTLNYYENDTLRPTGYPAEEDRVALFAYNANFVSPEVISYWDNAANYFGDTIKFLVADYKKGDLGFLNPRTDSMVHSLGDYNYPKYLYDGQYSTFIEDPGFKGYTSKGAEMPLIGRNSNGDATAELSSDNGQWGRYPLAEGHAGYPVAHDLWDFSYTNTKYASAANAGYPVGDLNWWPEKKAAWEANANKETFDAVVASVEDGTWEFKNWATGIKDRFNTKELSVSVYPNPSKGLTSVSVNLEKAGFVSVKVYNIWGSEVLNVANNKVPAGNFNASFNASELSSGSYFVKLTTDGYSGISKFIVD